MYNIFIKYPTFYSYVYICIIVRSDSAVNISKPKRKLCGYDVTFLLLWQQYSLCLCVLYLLGFYQWVNLLFWERINIRCSAVCWVCKILWLHLCRGVRPSPHNESHGYDIKSSAGVTAVMLELWEMHSIPSMPLFPGLLQPRVITLDSVISRGQTELLDI